MSIISFSTMSGNGVGGGLNNLGNTCFFNATIQSLLYTPPLAIILDRKDHSQRCRLKQSRQWCSFCEMESIFSGTRLNKRFSPSGMINHLKSIFKKFKLGRQEDSHQFLRYLIQGMQDAETGKLGKDRQANESKIKDTKIFATFGGIIKTCVQCLNCSHRSLTSERYYDFNIECQRSNSLQDGIASFFAIDKLEGNNKYLCQHCKERSNARKRFLLDTIPPIATFQLKRFTNAMRKIGKHIQFPISIDLGRHLQRPRKVILNLYAIIVHAGGSSYSGHYYAFVKFGNDWYKMDDGYVSKSNIESVLSQNAYMLFYHKVFEERQEIIQKQVKHQAILSKDKEETPANRKKSAEISQKITVQQKVIQKPRNTHNKQQPVFKITNQTNVDKNIMEQKQVNKDWEGSEDSQDQVLLVPNTLKRKRSKQQAQNSMPYQQLYLKTLQKIEELKRKMPLLKPRNRSKRQIYSLRKYEVCLQKKRKIG